MKFSIGLSVALTLSLSSIAQAEWGSRADEREAKFGIRVQNKIQYEQDLKNAEHLTVRKIGKGAEVGGRCALSGLSVGLMGALESIPVVIGVGAEPLAESVTGQRLSYESSREKGMGTAILGSLVTGTVSGVLDLLAKQDPGSALDSFTRPYTGTRLFAREAAFNEEESGCMIAIREFKQIQAEQASRENPRVSNRQVSNKDSQVVTPVADQNPYRTFLAR